MKTGNRTLSVNMRGKDVALLQENLKQLGFSFVDKEGFFGKSTKQAVLKFQKKQGLDMTGRVDERTATVIAEAAKAVKPGGGSQPPSQFIVKGQIRASDGSPEVGGVKVRAFETRIKSLNVVLADKGKRKLVEKALTDARGDWPVALEVLKKANLSEDSLNRLEFAHSLADLSRDNVRLIKTVVKEKKLANLRDVALGFNVEGLTRLMDPAANAGTSAHDKAKASAIGFRQRLFATQTTAVLHRMVRDAELPIADTKVLTGIAQFLDNQPQFNIRRTSIYTALKHPEAFKDIAEEHRPGVIENLKVLQRVQAISPMPEAVPVLIKAKLSSAFHVGEMPESTFVRNFTATLGESMARQVYTNAINGRVRNEHALMTMRETLKGTGLAVLDNGMKPMDKALKDQQIKGVATTLAEKHNVSLNLDTLFGDMDYCECKECTSVYSPAAYFVELLQFLRNNNFGPDPATGAAENQNIHHGILGTPLVNLFFRRPDLLCLELTCENTFTVLPYVDLVNEVMEKFVVLSHDPPELPLLTWCQSFNVKGETSSELLAEPKHTNDDAFAILLDSVYPFNLPYHQPIDAARIFLNYLGTSRFELLDTFRTATEKYKAISPLSSVQKKRLITLYDETLDRSVTAEFLRLTQEEYVILTEEGFRTKEYYEITLAHPYSNTEYGKEIKLRSTPQYFGYEGNNAKKRMLSHDESKQEGLTFVKKQFLPRTGIQYTDLVELLKTQFINPAFPQGKALTIMESLRFSYRFLQRFVDTKSEDPMIRYSKLVAFLVQSQPYLPLLDAMLHPNPCSLGKGTQKTISKGDLREWVRCYFERIGKLIVLESGEGPRLPVEGKVYPRDSEKLIGTLRQDGAIVNADGATIGQVGVTLSIKDKVVVAVAGPVLTMDGKSFVQKYGSQSSNWSGHRLRIKANQSESNTEAEDVDIKNNGRLYWKRQEIEVVWLPSQDTCNLDIVRLKHLDGTDLEEPEYARLHRFIRLWRKLGWTIDETDKTLVGLGLKPSGGANAIPATALGVRRRCPDIPRVPDRITPDFLYQLVAVRKLLDLTGLPLPKLLTFWTDLPTGGERSLYSTLFLTHNLLSIDNVFQADELGNYLTQPNNKISEHVPVLMAALKLKKADDVITLKQCLSLSDQLSLANVSALYRHALLSKLLHVKVEELADLIKLFGNPFKDADTTLELIETWGKMEDSGFTFRHLNYLINDHDDALRPLAPSPKTILLLGKTLFDGLNANDHDHPDILDKNEATSELVRSKAGLLFEQTDVEKLIGLLEGTTVYITNAPPNQTIIVPDPLAKKIKYTCQKDVNPPNATLQVTGILSDDEKIQADELCSEQSWKEAIERVGKQVTNFFNDALSSIFPDLAEATSNLFQSDVSIPVDLLDPNLPDPNTAPAKRFYFLKYFLPFLRQQLDRRFIITTLSSAVGLSSDVTDPLLTDILIAGPNQFVFDALVQLKEVSTGSSGGSWKGYLIPPADGIYSFTVIRDSQPATPLMIDGQAYPFNIQQEEPANVWSTIQLPKLKSDKLYLFEISDDLFHQLQWKTALSPRSPLPTSALLTNFLKDGTPEAFTKLYKVALIINGFGLSADEVRYWQENRNDFDKFDFNAITLQHWKRLQTYATLRDNLPPAEKTLLDLFKWSGKPDAPAKLSEQISTATGWKKESLDKLLSANHFALNQPEYFRNEISLIKLHSALKVADKIGMDIDSLFEWAKPGANFIACKDIAQNISISLRARYDQEDWEQIVKPLNDQLRENQKQALIGYLLVQKNLKDWGVVDADSLFEFFLIDVQMCACMETSRIKQAISSVQLFIHRCLLGLEDKTDDNGKQIGVPNDVIDRDRWEWMQRYRVWEANRKVFLYPENWILPELRDDKSPFYKELESELLQKDINKQTVADALKSYLYKVDEVANLKVVGLFIEQDIDKDGKLIFVNDNNPKYIKLHVFARTRNAPYFFYYRFFDMQESNWYPWEKVQVDIPNYDVVTSSDQVKVTKNGAYLIPVVWNRRLFIFFPQLQKKTASNRSQLEGKPFTTIGDEPPQYPVEYLEVKMGWSEYRNQKWTQKQISADAIYDLVPPFDLNHYQFAPRIITESDPRVVIDVFWASDYLIGRFHYAGSQLFKDESSTFFPLPGQTDFAVSTVDQTVHSLQAVDEEDPRPFADSEPYFTINNVQVTVQNQGVQRIAFHPFAHELLGQLMANNLDQLFAYFLNTLITAPVKDDAFGGDDKATVRYHELKRPYSLYNWEAAFHAPMQLVDRLLKSQQFEQALKMCHYVFNPLAKSDGTTDLQRFWQFLPFKEINARDVLDDLFRRLSANDPNDQQVMDSVNEWRNKPFQPHIIARSRPSAYMKWVVMKYIEILLAWGDYLFRQDTIETINEATQFYITASHLYGPRGQTIPKRGKVQPQTYLSLLDKWDAFGNAMVEMELAFPFCNQTSFPIGVSNGVVGLANVFGFATTLYFCIPDNPQLKALRDTIDDRLFKIRNCQNIEGVFRQLPLFEPPIDPGLLVQAAAQGISLASVLNDLNSPMPNYRFYYLLQKALELCSELKALGNSFLSVKEKTDAEALSKLRAKHESSIHNLMMEIKKQQLDESQKSLEALQQNRRVPVYRLQYFLRLIGDDLGKVPDENTEFGELPNQIEQPIDESGLKLIEYENEEMDKAHKSIIAQASSNAVEGLASILFSSPDIYINAMPFGVGETTKTGGSSWGSAASTAAKVLQIISSVLGYQSSSAARKAGFLRQLQDRVQQANIAGYEIKNIDKQLLTQKIRINIANQEITNQQQQIDNALEVEEFLRNKYTNEELYLWMDGSIRTLYHQAYTLAYELAKKAEKGYRFERGMATSNFIQFGYWDDAHDGMLAGERLYIGLKQLEAAYQEKRGFDFEVSKSVSLRQTNPLAFIQLRETGTCELALPEVLFDMDYPGHYMRRIKSVAVTIPCVVGPYTSVNCTLRLLEHKFRTSSNDKPTYVESVEETDDRFSTVNVPIMSIAVSQGQNDSGVFELNFHDERYLPFEGAGAISKWRLELPPSDFQQFDYGSISDVIMHLRYTSMDGGDKLKKAASASVRDYIKNETQLSRDEGLYAAFDLKHDFPNEWYTAMQPPVDGGERVLTLTKIYERLPFFTKGRTPATIIAKEMYLLTPKTNSQPISYSLSQGTQSSPFGGDGPQLETMKFLTITDVDYPLDTWDLKIQNMTAEIEELWLVARYVLV